MTTFDKMKSIPGQLTIQQTCRFIASNCTDGNTENTNQNMLKFPNTKHILWDHTTIGSDSQISISYYRKPRLVLSEKVLRFAHRHVESKGQTSCGCALVGQLSIDDDGEGLTFTVDRFDPVGDSLNNSYSLTPGDIAVPFQVMLNSKNERQSSADDYLQALQLLKQRCCSKNSIDLSNFLLTKGWCNIYTSGDKCVHHLEFDVVTMAAEFKATPITPVPIVPTALSKNLSGPMSMSHLQGEPKTGYLTMDHTRKVLLVLESDPKVANLPLVGIWVSGISFVYSPYIWACCLRYLHNSNLNDRVCVPPESFLLVLYNPMHSKPEFYEVTTSTGNTLLNFDLFNGYDVVNLPKTMTSGQMSIKMDLGVVDGGQKKEKFDGAIHLLKSHKSEIHDDVPKSTVVSTADEMTPRNMPAPHRSQLPVMTSMVPEVSLLFGEDSGIFMNPKKLSITQGKPNGVSHTSDFTRTKLHTNLPVLQELPNSQHLKSASGFSAQQNIEQNFQHNSVQNGRLAQNYINSIPKPGLTTSSSNQNTAYQDSIVQNSNPNSNPMFQNRTAQQDFIPQNRSQPGSINNPNAMYQSRPQQSNMANMCQMSSGQRLLPQASTMQVHQQPYPQYVQSNQSSVPYSYRPTQYPGYPQMPGTHGYIGQPQIPPHYTTQTPYSQQAPVNYPPQPANSIQQQFLQNQQGMMNPPSINQHQQFVPITPQNQVTVTNIVQDQRPSPNADSSKSSDDSGLSVTPEKQMPHPKPSNKSPQTDDPPDSILHSKNINWSQVPPEVYQLLVQQDAQLKKLQSQIQMLITNQSNSSQSTTTTELDTQMSSVNKQDSTVKTEMCSVAVNTTMFYPPQHQSNHSQQTSPQKAVPTSGENTPRQGSQYSSDDGRTPAEIRHRGVLPFNSTQKDDFDLDASQDLSNVVNNMGLHDKTIDSIQSDMIVDMPSYHSSPSRSEKSGDTLCNSQDIMFSNSMEKSPTSASMCGNPEGSGLQEDSEDEQEQVDTNDKEYYERLMNNIQLLLNQQSSESGMPGEITDTIQNDTLQQSIMLGQYINSIQHRSTGSNPLETTFIPKINYMSMMFDSDSDSSMEINAMAMKYLKDEQLTHMTKLQTKARLAGNHGRQRVAMLRHILSDDKEATPNVTTVGMSPNDMTFATRKYMEKHGLLNHDSKNTTTESNESYQLRLNYSTMSCRSESPVQMNNDLTSDPDNRIPNNSYKTPIRQSIGTKFPETPLGNSQNGINTPVNIRNRSNSHNVTNSPAINACSKANSPFLNSKTNSPFINGPTNNYNISEKQGRVNYHFTPSPGVQVSPQQQLTRERPQVLDEKQEVLKKCPAENQIDNTRPDDHYRHLFHDDDDKILDITRLRMLPKLL